MQLSKLAKVFSEEDCWTFFSDYMAPATSASAPIALVENTASSSEEQKDIIFEFLTLLGEKLVTLETCRVRHAG